MQEMDEQSLIRKEKLEKIKKNSYPYPNDKKVDTSASFAKVVAAETKEKSDQEKPKLNLAGRIMSVREMGKASFFNLQDRSGQIQVYIKKDEVGEEVYNNFKTFDLGDIVHLQGYAFYTKTGEPSIHATGISLLVKCLHPLPEKWHGLTDVEVRYRQRYLDLIVNQEVTNTFIKRARIIAIIRRFFDERDYIEVETPVMNTIASGAAARPFITHHNALDLKLNMRIALELPLKKLIVGGLERVYEIGRVFRNEGISTEHNPEFTMIEFYQAYATYEDLMNLTEELLVKLCDEVVGSREVQFKGLTVDFSPPFKRLTMAQAIHEFSDFPKKISLDTLAGVHQAAKHFAQNDILNIQDYGLALYEVFDRCIENKIVNPTFITQHPTSISPLARKNQKNPEFTDRFELMVAGMELANAFSELNDSEDQRERFDQQLRVKLAGNDEAMDCDEDFVTALEYGLPPTAGQGIGIDRLVMLLTNSVSIRDVILFPTMRPLANS